MKRRWFCQPCEHHWWQHRHPNRLIRVLGFAMMVFGVVNILIGLRLLEMF